MSVCFKYNSSNNPSIFLGKYVHSDILIYFLIRTKYCYGRQKVFCIRCIGLQTIQAYAILGYVIVCSVDMDAGTSSHACLRSKLGKLLGTNTSCPHSSYCADVWPHGIY